MSILIGYIDGDRSKRLHINDYDKDVHKGRVKCAHGHPIIGKKGDRQIWHYSHKSGYEGDCSREMGEWHKWWQDRMEDDFLEIIFEKEHPEGSGKIVKHIADAVNGDMTVIEFQKSVVSPHIIREREAFYDDMIWVFCCHEHRIEVLQTSGRYMKIKLVAGSKFFLEAKKRSFLDFNQRGVLEVVRVFKTELAVKIWTQNDFDRTFMQGCLKQSADMRAQRKPYDFEDSDDNCEQALKIFGFI